MKNDYLYIWKFVNTPVIVLFVLLVINPYESFKGIYSYGLVFFIFGIVPLLDFLSPNSSVNPASTENELRKNKLFDILVLSILPIQLISIVIFLIEFHKRYETESVVTLIGWGVTTGIFCGIYGINVGHELGHRVKSWQRFAGKALLFTSLRMSFYIEHNWGHHAHVSTEKDPASAKRNEIVYFFVPKSIFKTWLNSWFIQRKLLKKRNASFFSIYNDILWYTIIQWGAIGLVAFVFDWQTALAFIGVAFVGMTLLELTNYIEHYGLRRNKKNGKYERVLPIHSWNSNHSFSSAVLFNLSRHSDHHFISSKPYQILKSHDAAPNLPNGYAGMIVLALIPPLWFYVMNKKVDQIMSLEEHSPLFST